jgi:Zn-dependent protease with chaperone function
MERPFRGTYYDGEVATRWRVDVRPAGGSLEITKEDGAVITWPRGSFRRTQGSYDGEPLRFERDAEVLTVDERAILAHLGLADRNWSRGLLVFAVLLLALLVGGYFFGVPALAGVMAKRMPLSWEQQLGEVALADLAPKGRICDSAAANQALSAIVDRLMAAALATPYRIQPAIVRDRMVNAFAAPGGHVVVFSGLLSRTRSPEELAGVVAHELQHVVHRHPTKSLIRVLSVNALLKLIVGDMSKLIQVAADLDSLRYQRSDEDQADLDGMRMMRAARIDPAGMIAVFHTLERESVKLPEVMRYLSTHPLTRERIARLEAAARGPGAPPVPLLPGRPWQEIASSCNP